jgi:hypothetical protein
MIKKANAENEIECTKFRNVKFFRVPEKEIYLGVSALSFSYVLFASIHSHNAKAQVQEEFGKVADATTHVQRRDQIDLLSKGTEQLPNRRLPCFSETTGQVTIKLPLLFHS